MSMEAMKHMLNMNVMINNNYFRNTKLKVNVMHSAKMLNYSIVAWSASVQEPKIDSVVCVTQMVFTDMSHQKRLILPD